MRPVSEETASLLHQPHTFVLQEKEEILATVLANHYLITCRDSEVNGFYFRYFASSVRHRGNIFVARTSRMVLDWLKENTVSGTVFYAYLEKQNFHSSKLVASLGFEPAGHMATYGFSRFFPKSDLRVTRVTDASEKEMVTGLLKDFYRNHAMAHFESIHHYDRYYVLKEGAEIIAGVQVVKGEWKIKKMEGWSGRLILRFAGHIPLIKSLFNPDAFCFAGFEGIYFKPGRESDLMKLFEHVLSDLGLKSALFWQDPVCPYNLSGQPLGLLNRFVSGTGSALMVSFNDTPSDIKEKISSSPVYVSCFDFI